MRNLVSAVFMCQAATAQTLLRQCSHCCACFLAAWHFPWSCSTLAEVAQEKFCTCIAHIFTPQQSPAVFVPDDSVESLVSKQGDGWEGNRQKCEPAGARLLCCHHLVTGQLCSLGLAGTQAPSLPAGTLSPACWASATWHCGLQLQSCRSCAVAYPLQFTEVLVLMKTFSVLSSVTSADLLIYKWGELPLDFRNYPALFCLWLPKCFHFVSLVFSPVLGILFCTLVVSTCVLFVNKNWGTVVIQEVRNNWFVPFL